MNTVASVITGILSVVASIAFAVAAVVIVLLWVVVVGTVMVGRWIADAVQRSRPRGTPRLAHAG